MANQVAGKAQAKFGDAKETVKESYQGEKARQDAERKDPDRRRYEIRTRIGGAACKRAPRRCSMKSRHSSIVVAMSLAAAAPAFADDLTTRAFTPRQLAHCVMKRVRANAAESYRDAYKACKDQSASAHSDRATDTITAAALLRDPKQ